MRLLKYRTLNKKLLTIAIAGVVASSGVLAFAGTYGNSKAAGVQLNDSRNCDSNAIIYCGGMTPGEIQSKYYSNDPAYANIQAAYAAFGISSGDINSLGSTAQAGLVNKDGTVTVNGQVVATGAVTAGRQFIAGSQSETVPASYGGGSFTFYERSPSVSFLQNSLQAFVVMNGNQFEFAILASCGNPVRATPTPPPTPPAPPTPPTPMCTIPGETNLPANSPQCVPATPMCTVPGKTNLPANSPQCVPATPMCTVPGKTNLPANSPECVTPTPTPPAPTPPVLPNTGPGAVVGLFGATSVIGSFVARFWLKRRNYGL